MWCAWLNLLCSNAYKFTACHSPNHSPNPCHNWPCKEVEDTTGMRFSTSFAMEVRAALGQAHPASLQGACHSTVGWSRCRRTSDRRGIVASPGLPDGSALAGRMVIPSPSRRADWAPSSRCRWDRQRSKSRSRCIALLPRGTRKRRWGVPGG